MLSSSGTQSESNFAFDMMANCAHDLKTPLAAMFSSSQLTISILCDIQAVIEQMNPVPAGVLNDLEIAKSTLLASLNMTEFMKMSINRCMDFAKVSNHALKLNPKCETVEIVEALQLPLQCMMTVDPEQVIELKPLPEEVCSHVITDLQWLQENVLCLLSNAAKFSSNASITLSATLCPESSLVLLKESFESVKEEQSFSSKSGSEACTKETTASPAGRPPQQRSRTDYCVPELMSASSFRGLDEPTNTADYNAEVVDRMMVLIECEDSGIGLSEEAMANLFAPFKQAQRLAGGTGLGLFSLANRMEALQGLCGVRGRRDGAQGSLFWFAFPYKPDEEAALSAREQEQDQELTAEHLAQLAELQGGGRYTIDKVLHRKGIGALNTEVLPYSCGGSSSAHNSVSTPKQGWHDCHHRKLNNVVTPRASRQLPARAAPSPPVSTPFNSCPPSPGDPDQQPQLLQPSFSTTAASASSGHSPMMSTAGGDFEGREGENAQLHILLVDDTASIRKITSRTLQREGFRVTTAENGYEALKLLQNQTDRFDAVLMDLQMPVLDGLETVRRFRSAEVAQEGKRRQFIVAVSASADPTMAKSVIAMGFDRYMEKPFSMKVLHEMLPYDFGIAARTEEM